MEYQSFFMLLKKYAVIDGKFCSTSPLSAEGFVRIKKEQNSYSVVIQINNYTNSSSVFVVCNDNIIKSQITSSTTYITTESLLQIDSTCVLLPELGLFASKNGTEICDKAISKIINIKQENDTKQLNILEKVFGKVYDTYFFDSIKCKLANLFALGTPAQKLNSMYPKSKWVMVETNKTSKLLGVIYKDNFAYAIGVGDEVTNKVAQSLSVVNATSQMAYSSLDSSNNKSNPYKNVVDYNGKNYSLLFLSANNGKFIDI